MRAYFSASGCAILMGLLACAVPEAAAELPRVDPFDRANDAPTLALGLSSGQVRRLEFEFDDDLRALDAFAGKPRKMAGLGRTLEERGVWTFYGRLGLLNFQNQLDPRQGGASMRFKLGRTGPKLTGRIYIGIHRKF